MAQGEDGATAPEPPAKPKPCPSAHYLWAALIARIYEVFPLICPNCGGQMRIGAFITFSADIHKILDHIGVQSEPDWATEWDGAAQPAPDSECFTRIEGDSKVRYLATCGWSTYPFAPPRSNGRVVSHWRRAWLFLEGRLVITKRTNTGPTNWPWG